MSIFLVGAFVKMSIPLDHDMARTLIRLIHGWQHKSQVYYVKHHTPGCIKTSNGFLHKLKKIVRRLASGDAFFHPRLDEG